MRLFKDHWLAAVLGFLFGLISPVAGVFVGLQVSSQMGTILAWPLVAVSAMTGVPFGQFSGLQMISVLLLSGAIWSVAFVLAATWLARLRR